MKNIVIYYLLKWISFIEITIYRCKEFDNIEKVMKKSDKN